MVDVDDPPSTVRAYCAIGHSWLSLMHREYQRVVPGQRKKLEPVLAEPLCPHCSQPQRWTRFTDPRHGT